MKNHIHHSNNTDNKPYSLDLLLLIIGLTIFYGVLLGHYPLFPPDEARYAEIGREMVTHGHWFIPHLNGILYFEKPIFFYWLQAFSVKALGLSEWSMRFWTAFFAVFGCVMTYITARQLYNRKTGWYAAIILATSPLYFIMGHAITLDMTVSVLMTTSLFLFLMATQQTTVSARRNLIWGAAVFAALAVLTKGLIGIVFPGVIVGLWVIICRKWDILKNKSLLSGLLIFGLIAIPWHLFVQYRYPAFLHFYFITQQFLRYSTHIAHRGAPWYLFSVSLLFGFLPWTWFLYQMIRSAWRHRSERRQHATEIFLIIWVLFILLFFSCSDSKLIPYIIPIFPPLSLLTARYLVQTKALACIKWLATCIGICLISILYFAPQLNTNSIKPLAIQLDSALTPQDTVVSYQHYFQDLPFYTRRLVYLAACSSELDFGVTLMPHMHRMLSKKQFLTLLNSPRRVFAIAHKSNYLTLKRNHPHAKIYKWAQNKDNVLFCNRPAKKLATATSKATT